MDLRFERGADAFKHQIKSRQTPQGQAAYLNGNLLEHAQHGALSNGTMLAFKGVVIRQSLNGGLEQRELVRDKGIRIDKMFFISEVFVVVGAVGKVEQRFEAV